ncbi:serine/threonine-protein kinase bud32 [Recurvomyces mirabilis]|uniref:EKC/KEOPS complex subunit BUD32 n=1 Tax=Recurvomyces mirabilis TaxID=574656 RepID=A0AAE1BZF6_9PEZI|nr:serine/threonine-protein kinase bud32 [Recurvomyces mirabilis]KAK5149431.1 serine/threonine-protein kinase bud32 [Recurvomyces mirabilis]
MADAASSSARVNALHKFPPPFDTSDESFELIAQGAESLLYRTTFSTTGQPAALKVRPEKKWRHPILDKRLTRARILAEARVLVKLSGEGIAAGGSTPGKRAKVKQPKEGEKGVAGLRGFVPAVLALDWERGWMMTEWVYGRTVKQAIHDTQAGRRAVEREQRLQDLKELLRRIGEVVGKLHASGVIHGDLTTSNMMLRPYDATTPDPTSTDSLDGDVVLIDFGLSTQSVSDEDRAVDLYVLERAFGSTHPREEDLFPEVLTAYAENEGSGMNGKVGKLVLRKLEDVRMRGRKKSMVG